MYIYVYIVYVYMFVCACVRACSVEHIISSSKRPDRLMDPVSFLFHEYMMFFPWV